MWLLDGHFSCNEYNNYFSTKYSLPSYLPIVERVFHTFSFCVLQLFANTQQTYGYVDQKIYTFFDAMIYVHH